MKDLRAQKAQFSSVVRLFSYSFLVLAFSLALVRMGHFSMGL